MSRIEPFLRWAGGKSWMIPSIAKIIDSIDYNHYHEPFLGGGSVFFSLNTKYKSYLSDANEELVLTYQAIQNNAEAVAMRYVDFQNNEEAYYLYRSQKYDDLYMRAARFIYLNQTSFNGLYRVNNKGEYNVPYGFRTSMQYDVSRIFQAGKKLQNVRISYGDFTSNKRRIRPNDLVFLDPPYTVTHNNNGFIKYNQHLFSYEDQKRLSQYIDFIKHHDAFYILTNAAHPTILTLFEKGDYHLILERSSIIGGTHASRRKVTECIFTNIPLGGII